MMNQSVSTVNNVLTNFCMRDNKHLDTHVCYDRECVYYPVCLENSSYISINSEPLPDEPESSTEEFTPYGFQTVMEESEYLEDDTQITVKNNVPYPLHCNKTVRPIYTPPEVYTELFKIKVTKEDFLRGLKHAVNIVRPTDTTSILQSFYIKTCVRDCYFYLVASTGFHSYMTKINAVYEGVTDLQPDIEYIVPYDEFLNDITYAGRFITIIPLSDNDLRIVSSNTSNGEPERYPNDGSDEEAEDTIGKLGKIISSLKTKDSDYITVPFYLYNLNSAPKLA